MPKPAFDLDHLARLARLPLEARTKEKFRSQLAAILDYVDEINKVKTGKAAAGASTTITGLQNVFRKDEPDKNQCLPQQEALKNAPNTQNGYFKTKAIFE